MNPLTFGRSLSDAINAVVLGQPEMAELITTALIAREHVAIVGPAGEGKTLAASVASKACGLSSFYRLLSRYSTPEEVLGPWSLAALQLDRYERKLGGGACSELIVLDEVFKANSPMLNGLLGLLNERSVDGAATPLQTCIGLSNEWPRGLTPGKREGGDESLSPLWDRFLFRHEVTSMTDEVLFDRLISGDSRELADVKPIDGLEAAQAECSERVRNFGHARDVIGVVLDLRAALAIKGIHPSARRWKKAVRAVCASSVYRGAGRVEVVDLDVLKSVLWDRPDQRQLVADAIADAMPPEQRFIFAALAEARILTEKARSRDDWTRALDRIRSLLAEADVVSPGHELIPELEIELNICKRSLLRLIGV